MQALQMSMVFPAAQRFFSGFIFRVKTMPWIFMRFERAVSDDIFHRAYARDHFARRETFSNTGRTF